MKLVAIGDIHANNWKDFSTTLDVVWDSEVERFVAAPPDVVEATPMNSRLHHILNGLCDVRNYCEKNGIKLCLIAGDLFHTRGSVDTIVYNSIYRVLDSFNDYDVEIIMIAGNHDQANSAVHADNSLYPLSASCRVVSKPQVVRYVDPDTDEALDICCVPFSKDKPTIMAAVEKMSKLSEVPKILLAHLGLSGGLVGSGNYVMSDEYNLMELKATKFKYCVFGHYHKPQVLEYNSIYTGSLLQNTFNDEGDHHGFWVIDTSRRWDMELVPLHYPEFITVTTSNCDKLTAKDLSENYVRVQATAKDASSVMDVIEGLSEDATGDSQLVDGVRLEVEKDYEAERQQRSDISITMDTPEILKTYVTEHNDTGLSMEALMKKGLEILFKVQGGE